MTRPWRNQISRLTRTAKERLHDAFTMPAFDPVAEFEAQQARQRQAERDSVAEAAQRLAPFAGRLVLLTDYADGNGRIEDETMQRLMLDLDHAGFMSQAAYGVSAHMDIARRSSRANQYQENAVDAVAGALKAYDKRTITSSHITANTNRADWLAGVARAAEATCEFTQQPPTAIGHIAVVSAMDLTHQLGLVPVPFYGEAFLMRSVDPDAAAPFTIELISTDPHRQEVEGL